MCVAQELVITRNFCGRNGSPQLQHPDNGISSICERIPGAQAMGRRSESCWRPDLLVNMVSWDYEKLAWCKKVARGYGVNKGEGRS